jgi:hypothetical protein
MTHGLRSLIAGLIVPLAAACSDSTAPGSVPDEPIPTPGTPSAVGRYALSGAAGLALPALVNRSRDTTTGDVIDTYVVSDTLEVTADGRYAQRARLEARIGGQVVGRSNWIDHGRLSSGTSTLAFASDYIENVAFTGRLESTGGMRVQQDLAREGNIVEYAFARLPALAPPR